VPIDSWGLGDKTFKNPNRLLRRPVRPADSLPGNALVKFDPANCQHWPEGAHCISSLRQSDSRAS